MTASLKNGPMTEAELEQLDAFLAESLVPHNGMSLEILDGFFSALVVGPELVMPSEYLAHVWGDAPAALDLEEASARMSLVMRLWNHIAWRVQQPIDEEGDLEAQAFLMPPLALPAGEEELGDAEDEDPLAGVPEDFPFAAGWAHGFLHGVSLRGDAWDAWLDDQADFQDDLSMLIALSVVDAQQAREMELPPDIVMTLEERLQSAVELPGMLHDLNLLRLQPVRTPIRRQATPGRNDPCSCGSGKKFKKCCGASGQQLH